MLITSIFAERGLGFKGGSQDPGLAEFTQPKNRHICLKTQQRQEYSIRGGEFWSSAPREAPPRQAYFGEGPPRGDSQLEENEHGEIRGGNMGAAEPEPGEKVSSRRLVIKTQGKSAGR